MVECAYGDSSWGDLLTAYNGQTITYDAIGNPLTYRDGITMTWQNGRELATFKKGTVDVSYTYDTGSLRTCKSVVEDFVSTEYNYVYENGLLRQMTYGNHIFNFSYDVNGTPVSLNHIVPNAGLDEYYYYGVNSRGDVEALYYSDGSLYATYDYDAYGKLLGITSYSGSDLTDTNTVANNNPLRYRSYVYDTETGLYYLQSRYYDPTTCRFINADGYVSTGQDINGYNMFAYCNNNPVICSDPTGHCMKAWAEGYQGPCPGIGKPGCMDYSISSESDMFAVAPVLTQEPIDTNAPPDHPEYTPPKKWDGKKVKNPNGKGKGWPAKDTGVWIPDNKMDGGPGWVIQYPGGHHNHAYPGGKMRNHFQLEQPHIGYSIAKLAVGGIVTVIVIADDATGYGVADDPLLALSTACFVDGLDGMVGKRVCSVCGEVRYGYW